MKQRIINGINTIRFKLIVIFVILFLIPFLLVETVIFRTIENRTRLNTNEQMVNSLRLVSDYTTTFLTDIQTDFQNLIFQEDFMLSLFNVRNLGDITTLQQLEAVEKLSDTFEAFLENDRIHSVYLYNLNNDVFYDFSYLSANYLEDDIIGSEWFTRFDQGHNNGKAIYNNNWPMTQSIPNIGHQNPDNIVSFYTQFQSTSSDTSILSVNVDTLKLMEVLTSLTLPENATMYITDRNNRIVAGNMEDSIGHDLSDLYVTTPKNNEIILKDTQERHISYYSFDMLGYNYLIDIPYSHIIASANESRMLLYGLYFAIILILLTMNIVIQRFLLKPIDAMIKKMRHVEQGNFDITLPDDRKDELGTLYRNFNEMTRNIHGLIETNYVEVLLRKQSDLNYIQTQLNEHFLYNTMDAIYSLILIGDQEKAQQMLLSLSRFFRTTLNNGKKVITLQEITLMLENYSKIMLLRNNGKYTIDIQVDDHILNCYALKFLFQPILENAIIHGVSNRRQGGIIKLRIQGDDHHIIYSVWDNGKGIEADTVKRLNRMFENTTTENQNDFFALNNIVNQAKLFYKTDFSIHIESELNTYSKCIVTLPILTTPPDEGAFPYD